MELSRFKKKLILQKQKYKNNTSKLYLLLIYTIDFFNRTRIEKNLIFSFIYANSTYIYLRILIETFFFLLTFSFKRTIKMIAYILL